MLYTVTRRTIKRMDDRAPRISVAVFHLNNWGNFCWSLINTDYLWNNFFYNPYSDGNTVYIYLYFYTIYNFNPHFTIS
jgi:hypothetical protein